MSQEKVPYARAGMFCEPDASDDEVLRAVVGHYVQCLVDSPEISDFLVGHFGVDPVLAKQLSIGYSNRTLGLALPERNRAAGATLRERLIGFGVYRPNGREHFRGCVVVPVMTADGTIVGLYGVPTAKPTDELWANGLPGSMFNGQAASDSTVVIVPTICDCIAAMGCGHESVIGPGRRGGFNRADIKALASTASQCVLIGDGIEEVAHRLAAHGVRCSHISPGTSLSLILTTSSDRFATLQALIEAARPVATEPGIGPGNTREPTLPETPPTAPGSPDQSVQVTGDVYELHISTLPRVWRIRGADKASATDTLRVSVCVTDMKSGAFHLDSLDLYSAKARTGFLESAATQLRCDVSALIRELGCVVFATEQAIKDRESVPETPTMTDDEREAAMELLLDPSLMGRVISDLASLGVVGEETNLATAYLSAISRLSERPFGVIVQSSSAAGKSTLADAVCSLVPPEDLVSYSALTGQALYYVGAYELSHKVLFVSEEAGAHRASYALKLLVTEGHLSIATTGKDASTGRLSTRAYEVAGPVALVMTTTATEIDPELANRLVVLGVDEDATQTQRVHCAQRYSQSLDGLISRHHADNVARLHHNAQRLLESLPVVIADDCDLSFPSHRTRHRRDLAKLLSIVCASALLHQYQRPHGSVEVNGKTIAYVEASPDDVELAMGLASAVFASGADELAPQTRALLDYIVALVSERASENGCAPLDVCLSQREVREATGVSEYQVRHGLARLVALEYLVVRRASAGHRHAYGLADDPKEKLREPRDTPRWGRERDSRGQNGPSPGKSDHGALRDHALRGSNGANIHIGTDRALP